MPFQPRSRYTWRLRTRVLELGERTLVMGILNVTPDSFSDGGQYLAIEAAVERGLELLEEGADILDVGAESTRPDAIAVDPAAEQGRLFPLLEAIRRERPDAMLSVDTYHASTAKLAMDLGVEIVNDVSGLLWDGAMAGTLAHGDLLPGVVLMHTRGTPGEWTSLPRVEMNTVAPMVRTELEARLRDAERAGIDRERILIDPGFGFGKLGCENFALLARMELLGTLQRPVLVGISRKGFLASTRARGNGVRAAQTPELRLHATIAANTAAILAGAHVVRVHDVGAAIEAAYVADAVLAVL